jgi:hypothetical protein
MCHSSERRSEENIKIIVKQMTKKQKINYTSQMRFAFLYIPCTCKTAERELTHGFLQLFFLFAQLKLRNGWGICNYLTPNFYGSVISDKYLKNKKGIT